MADWRQVFQNNPELQRFVLPRVRPTGRELGRGAYGSVEELEVNGLVCAGKRLYEVFLEDGNADVENIVHRYQEECQVTSTATLPMAIAVLTQTIKLKLILIFTTADDGRYAAPSHCTVPGVVLFRRLNTTSAGDGTTGQ